MIDCLTVMTAQSNASDDMYDAGLTGPASLRVSSVQGSPTPADATQPQLKRRMRRRYWLASLNTAYDHPVKENFHYARPFQLVHWYICTKCSYV